MWTKNNYFVVGTFNSYQLIQYVILYLVIWSFLRRYIILFFISVILKIFILIAFYCLFIPRTYSFTYLWWESIESKDNYNNVRYKCIIYSEIYIIYMISLNKITCYFYLTLWTIWILLPTCILCTICKVQKYINFSNIWK